MRRPVPLVGRAPPTSANDGSAGRPTKTSGRLISSFLGWDQPVSDERAQTRRGRGALLGGGVDWRDLRAPFWINTPVIYFDCLRSVLPHLAS